MKTGIWRRIATVAVIAVPALAVVAGVVMLRAPADAGRRSGAEIRRMVRENPFEYDIAGISKVDTALIGYRLARTVSFSVDEPSGICVDRQDRIYVAGSGGVFRIDSTGAPVQAYPSQERVLFCTVDEGGRVHGGTSRSVSRYAPDAGVERIFETGTDSSILVSVAAEGNNLFIGDAGTRCVWRFDTTGRVLNRIGMRDSVRGISGFILPDPHLDVVIGQGGSIWAANTGRHLVENYRFNGDLVASWGAPGNGIAVFCGCCNPICLAMLPDGGFVTGEKGIVRVKVYDQAGVFDCVVAPPSAFHSAGDGVDLAVDSHGNILVLVAREKVIWMYEKKQQI